MLKQMIFNLCLTIIAELLFAAVLKVRNKYDLVEIVLINCVTNPVINYILNTVLLFGNIQKEYFYCLIALLEIGVVISEGMFYKKTLRHTGINPFVLSFLLNCASYLSGLTVIIVRNN